MELSKLILDFQYLNWDLPKMKTKDPDPSITKYNFKPLVYPK